MDMAAVQLGTKAAGSIVKITVNGTSRDFIVAHQGKPSSIYDDSFNGGTIVLMKDVYERRAWNSSNLNDWANSTLKAYLDSTFYSLIDPLIAAQIKQVKIPYRPGSGASSVVNSGASGLSCKIFLPGAYEVGSGSFATVPADGATLSCFSGIESTGNNSKRIAYLNGTALYWWLRSPSTGSSTHSWYVNDNGFVANSSASVSRGVRPAFVLPSTLMVLDDGTIVANTAPAVPASINIPGTIIGGTQIAISWPASTDTDGNLEGYKLERSLNGGAWELRYQATGTSAYDTVPAGTSTVAYRVKAYDAAGAESAYQTSPTRTVVNNTAPTAPSSITVPVSPAGGEDVVVSWAASTDANNNLSGYRLERKVDNGSWGQITQTTALSYRDTVTKGWAAVAYRVQAYDPYTASAWTTSPTRTVDNAVAPAITGDASGDLGSKTEGFAWGYTVDHADGEAVTVTEAIDGVKLREYTAALGGANTFVVTGMAFMTLLNGKRTMTVTAAIASGKKAVHTVTFTKTVFAAEITLAEPIATYEDAPITKMVMSVTRNLPADATFTCLATNNALDPEPVWEDVTQSVRENHNHLFANTQLATTPAFNFIVRASRGPSNIGGWISSVGGAFE
jgi:hypothetical protein